MARKKKPTHRSAPILVADRTFSAVSAIIIALIFIGFGIKVIFFSHGAIGTNAYNTVGFYPCDAVDKLSCLRIKAAELSRPLSDFHVTLMTDSSSPQNMAGNGWGYFVGDGSAFPYQWQTVTPRQALTISVPLAFGGQNPSASVGAAEMSTVASGAYDSDYQQLVQYVLNAGYTDITWRLGWEFDGNWYPWSSQNSPSGYIAAYRHVHDLIKGMMPNASFDWCGTKGYTANWAAAYPGDSYVDYVGLDTYDSNKDTTQVAFNSEALPSLQYQENLALAHTKRITYPEWGLTSDNPSWIQFMYNWFNSLPSSGAGSLYYNDFFNANDGTTSLDDAPNAKALFVSLFGGTTNIVVGDINNDGVVNSVDLSILASHFGQTGQSLATGDLNNDGVVNTLDLSILAAHWGN